MADGRLIFYLRRLMNFRYNRTAEDDKLTLRMLEPARDGEPEGIEINFEGMKSKFYELMEMDLIKGIPLQSVLETYGMSDESKAIWAD